MLIKTKSYIPEIFVGALLAVAIFGLGVAFELSRFPASNNQLAGAANNSGSLIGAQNSTDKLTDWLLVGINFFLVVSTVGLWIATNRSARISERALTQLERPFVGIKILEDGLTNLENGVEHKQLRFKLVNYGRAPAIITQLFDDLVICPFKAAPKPPDLTTDENEIPSGFIIGPDADAYQLSTRTYKDCFLENELRAFTMGTDDIFFLGFIRYSDIGGKKYRTGFCMKWTVPEESLGSFPFLYEGDSRYNYTSEE